MLPTKRPHLAIVACAILITAFVRASAPQVSSASTSAQPVQNIVAQAGSQTFPETGQTIAGDFLTYWNEHGALAQQGYPISPEMQEVSEIDGKAYTVQYFERTKFEKHPEQAAPANRVLLELFGVQEYRDRYPQAVNPQGAPNQAADTTPGSVLFDLTGKRLGGTFLEYWKTHGDVRQQGYPISDVFEEVAEDGKTYKVQYFERAKFELHTEFAGTANEVLLSRIGAKFLDKRYVKNADNSFTTRPTPTAEMPKPPTPTATATPVPTAQETATPEAAGGVEKVPGKEWFGGFDMSWKYVDANGIEHNSTWYKKERGVPDLEKNWMMMIAEQGRYGGSVEEVENNIKGKIVQLDVPIWDPNVPGNYSIRGPSIITSKTINWDPSTPINFVHGAPPAYDKFSIADSRYYTAIVSNENNEISIITNEPDVPLNNTSVGTHIERVLEIMAKLKTVDNYPKDRNGTGDFLNWMLQNFMINPNYPYSTILTDFYDRQNVYAMFWSGH